MQKRIARGELAAEHPLATELWRRGHAAGAAAPRHAAPRRRQAARQGPRREGRGRRAVRSRARLGMTDADVELAEFLVRQHLTMSHLSQRRDLADPEVDRAVRRAGRRRRAPRAALPAHAVRHRDDRARQPHRVEGRPVARPAAAHARALPRRRCRRRRRAEADAPSRRARKVVAARGRRTTAIGAPAMPRALVDGIDPRLFTQLDAAPGRAPRPARRGGAAQAAARSRSRSTAFR